MLGCERGCHCVSLGHDARHTADLHSGEQSAKSSSHGGCRYVDADAEQELVALVEAGDEEGKATMHCLLVNANGSMETYLRHYATFENT